MVFAQVILVTPIIVALTRQTIEDLWGEYCDELTAMNVGAVRRVGTLIWDGRLASSPTCLPDSGEQRRKSGPS
jgi:tungstate transport system permease protein